MDRPLVTIAIPTYNRADQYLKLTLESALSQTYENIEILVSDNCSTDHTPELVQSYSDSRLKYIRQKENLGQNGNVNFLLNEAKGDYFQLLHDDDLTDSDFVQACMEKANFRRNIGIIMSGSRVIDENGEVLRENENLLENPSIGEFILSWYGSAYRSEVNIYLCCTLYGTHILRQTGGYEEKYNFYDDVASHFKCTAKAGRVDVKEVKASFRKHPESATSSTDVDVFLRDASALLDLACSLAPNEKDEIRKIGSAKSAKNIYMYANSLESKSERFEAFRKIFKHFGYKHLPPYKYCNQLVPFSGYILHPYHSMSLLKSRFMKIYKK